MQTQRCRNCKAIFPATDLACPACGDICHLALIELGKQSPDGVNAAQKLLDGPDPVHRFWAAWSLVKMEHPPQAQTIKKTIIDVIEIHHGEVSSGLYWAASSTKQAVDAYKQRLWSGSRKTKTEEEALIAAFSDEQYNENIARHPMIDGLIWLSKIAGTKEGFVYRAANALGYKLAHRENGQVCEECVLYFCSEHTWEANEMLRLISQVRDFQVTSYFDELTTNSWVDFERERRLARAELLRRGLTLPSNN